MEKRKKSVENAAGWSGIFQTAWKGLIVAAVLLVAGILLDALLLCRGIVPLEQLSLSLAVVCALEAFGATAFTALLQKRGVFFAALLTQAVLLVALLMIGMLIYEATVDWVHLGVTGTAVLAAVLVAAALFGGRAGGKKKKFKKNADRRLKKK